MGKEPVIDFVSMNDFSKEAIELILQYSTDVQKSFGDSSNAWFKEKYGVNVHGLFDGLKMGALFLENSTRTNFSSRGAFDIGGGSVDGFPTMAYTSLAKGESWMHTVSMFMGYHYDAIVMRSTVEGLPKATIDYLKKDFYDQNEKSNMIFGSDVPFRRPMIVNGGDGKNQHPTQCMLDLFTIKSLANKLGKNLDDEVELALMNDLKYGRTISSLVSVAPLFNFKLHLVTPDQRFALPDYKIDELKRKGVSVTDHGDDFMSAMSAADIAYHTRPQKERMGAGEDLETVIRKGQLTREMMDKLGVNAPFFLHPLPVDMETFAEISHDLDLHPMNYTKMQSSLGIPSRIAIMAIGLGRMYVSNPEIFNPPEFKETSYKKLPMAISFKSGNFEDITHKSTYVGDGVVIDHIPATKGTRLLSALGFSKSEYTMVPGFNLDSKTYGKKDIIKIHEFYDDLTPEQHTRIALIAPNATISVIKEGKISKKYKLEQGNKLSDSIICGNDACVTNQWKENVGTIYKVIQMDEGKKVYECGHCGVRENLLNIDNRNGFNYLPTLIKK